MAAFVLIKHSMTKAMAVDLTHHHRLNREELLGALIIHLAVLKE